MWHPSRALQHNIHHTNSSLKGLPITWNPLNKSMCKLNNANIKNLFNCDVIFLVKCVIHFSINCNCENYSFLFGRIGVPSAKLLHYRCQSISKSKFWSILYWLQKLKSKFQSLNMLLQNLKHFKVEVKVFQSPSQSSKYYY